MGPGLFLFGKGVAAGGSGDSIAAVRGLCFGKDFTGEGKNLRLGVPPGIGEQSGFAASLLEESFPAHSVRDGHLGKEQAAVGPAAEK